MAPSSSGLGHLVLIQEIRGSTPLGATDLKNSYIGGFLIFGTLERSSDEAV